MLLTIHRILYVQIIWKNCSERLTVTLIRIFLRLSNSFFVIFTNWKYFHKTFEFTIQLPCAQWPIVNEFSNFLDKFAYRRNRSPENCEHNTVKCVGKKSI